MVTIQDAAPPRRDAAGPRRALTPGSLALGAAMLVAFALLIALGTWQVHRRAWKLDLIARVNARIEAVAIPAPGPSDWPDLTATNAEYRHVNASGVFLNDRETEVLAVTALGSGYWVLTPLRTARGFTVLVNRGFVPADLRLPTAHLSGEIAGDTTVTGLLRITEPKGTLIESNDPGSNQWYSRDVVAIAAARGLGPVAPYFIDADATPNPGRYPVGGLTVVAFPNNHLVYALTWFGLAALLAAAAVRMVVRGRAVLP